MLKAEYQHRGPVPQDVIEAVELTLAEPAAGQVRVTVLAAPINPSDVLTLTGAYGMLPPLPAGAADAYCRESHRFGALFGLAPEDLPADRAGLDALVAETAAGGALGVGAAGAELARFFVERGGGVVGRLVPRWYVALTAGLLPAALGEAFALPRDARADRAAGRALGRLRRLYPRLPPRLRYVAPYHEALERLAGRAAPTLPTRLGNLAWVGRSRLPGAP